MEWFTLINYKVQVCCTYTAVSLHCRSEVIINNSPQYLIKSCNFKLLKSWKQLFSLPVFSTPFSLFPNWSGRPYHLLWLPNSCLELRRQMTLWRRSRQYYILWYGHMLSAIWTVWPADFRIGYRWVSIPDNFGHY